MAAKTINYGLEKPADTDFYDIRVFNENADIVDTEIKNVNDRLNIMQGTLQTILPAASWSDTLPYTQTVAVEGIQETDMPVIECTADISTKAEKKALQKNWNLVDRIVTGDGTITAYCNFGKPSVDLPLKIKGA